MDTFQPTFAGAPSEYGVTLNDAFSNARVFMHAPSKDKIAGLVIGAVKMLQTQSGATVKRLHCDGGSEFVNATLKNFRDLEKHRLDKVPVPPGPSPGQKLKKDDA